MDFLVHQERSKKKNNNGVKLAYTVIFIRPNEEILW